MNAIAIPEAVRALLEAPNYVHLATLRSDGAPRNWVVWAGLEGDHVLVVAADGSRKAADMHRDPRVALSVFDLANPYRMAALTGRVIQTRPDTGYRSMDPIAVKYTSAPFPKGGPGLVCFVIAVEHAYQRTLGWATHNPAAVEGRLS